MATLSVTAAAYFSGLGDAKLVLVAALGASAALGVSGAWGAYLTERAERTRSMKELERELFTSLRGTTIERASRTATAFVATIDGVAPLLVSLVCLSPMFLSLAGLVPVSTGVYATFGVALAILFGLGVFLSRISQTNLWLHGGAMMLAGLLVFVFVYLLGAA